MKEVLPPRIAMFAVAWVGALIMPTLAAAQDDHARITSDLSRPPPSGYVRLQGRVRPVDPARTKTMARVSFEMNFNLCNAAREMRGGEPQAFSPAQQARLDELFDSFTIEEMYDERSGAARREFRQAGAALNFNGKTVQSGVLPNCLAYTVHRYDRTEIWHADGSSVSIAYDNDGQPKSVRQGMAKPPALMRLDAAFPQRTIAGETCTEVPVSAAVIFPKGRCLWNRYAGRHEKNLPLPLETVHQVLGEEFRATAVEALGGVPDRWNGFERLPEGAQALLDHPPPRPARVRPTPPPTPFDVPPDEGAPPTRGMR